MPEPSPSRGREVRAVFVWTGAANLAVLAAKVAVGLASGSAAVLGDALHSLADVSNNAVALVTLHFALAPPDREHPYGHHKYETLTVFGLALMLSVLAVELALRTLERGAREVLRPEWGIATMVGVLLTNVVVASWQHHKARQLDSDLLHADARHTLSDVLVTLAVIAGWHSAADGRAWLDTAITLAIAALILYLAFELFRRAIPVLVDQSAVDPDELREIVDAVAGVRSTRRVRSRGRGREGWMDVVVTVDPGLSTQASHRIADEVERALAERFESCDITVHVEPHLHTGGTR